MAIQRRVNWISQQRVDVPDVRAVESAASNDWDQAIQALITNTSQGYIMRGFEISMTGAIGGAASNLQMIVDPGALLHISASQSGTVFMVPAGTPAQQLNGATNTNVNGSFVPNAINYIGIDYKRFIDPTTDAQVYLWDPTTKTESTMTAPRAQILTFSLSISTTSWASNLLPIAIVQTDAGNNVVSITDCRWLLFRLGTGGANPDPFFTYPWTAQTEGRVENPSTSSSNGSSPFEGGDKMLFSMKDWMNAIMTSLEEVKGTPFWYSSGSSGSLATLREDLGNTVTTGNGTISHGILPNAIPVLTTTGNILAGSNQLTSLGSTAGLVAGQAILATGIPFQTKILEISGSTVTMSNNATTTTVGVSVSFFSPAVITAPGQVNWDQDIFLKVIGARLSYKFVANPSSSNVLLADNQVAYVTLTRNIAITPNLIFTNSSAVVTSVGSVAWTSPLISGDWIKLSSDSDAGYYQILSVDSSSQVTLTTAFVGVSTGPSGAKARYALGTYNSSSSPSTARDIFIVNRNSVPSNPDVFWFLLRADNGGSVPRVYVRFIGQELEQGDSNIIDDGIPRQLLQYIGSPSQASSKPQYESALDPGSIPEITSITPGAASTISSNQYFIISSSGNFRRYYVWFNKDGTGVDPKPNLFNASAQVVITTGQTAAQVASAIADSLNSTAFIDFSALATGSNVVVTNSSAGASDDASNFNVGAPFAISTSQQGTGLGNFSMQDGDNLTLAIKKLDKEIAIMNSFIGYDENIDIVSSGATPPTSLNGPVSPGTNITLPNNTRNGSLPQQYIVGKAMLLVFLNGELIRQGVDWNEVGSLNTTSSQIQTLITLVAGDQLEIRINAGAATSGLPGPQGPQGPPGADAAGGPVSISTKTSNYSVMLTDCVLRANATGGSIIFTLPTAASATGRLFYFKKIDSTTNSMVIMGSGLETIDGSNTVTTTVQYTSYTIISNGTSWDIL